MATSARSALIWGLEQCAEYDRQEAAVSEKAVRQLSLSGTQGSALQHYPYSIKSTVFEGGALMSTSLDTIPGNISIAGPPSELEERCVIPYSISHPDGTEGILVACLNPITQLARDETNGQIYERAGWQFQTVTEATDNLHGLIGLRCGLEPNHKVAIKVFADKMTSILSQPRLTPRTSFAQEGYKHFETWSIEQMMIEKVAIHAIKGVMHDLACYLTSNGLLKSSSDAESTVCSDYDGDADEEHCSREEMIDAIWFDHDEILKVCEENKPETVHKARLKVERIAREAAQTLLAKPIEIA